MAEHLWAIVQHYIDEYGATEAEVARRAGLSKQLLNKYKRGTFSQMPARQNLEGLARVCRVPYREVLDAALRDAGFIDD